MVTVEGDIVIRGENKTGFRGNRGGLGNWSGRWDSNPRLFAWEANTLPLSYARPLVGAIIIADVGVVVSLYILTPGQLRLKYGNQGNRRSGESRNPESSVAGTIFPGGFPGFRLSPERRVKAGITGSCCNCQSLALFSTLVGIVIAGRGGFVTHPVSGARMCQPGKPVFWYFLAIERQGGFETRPYRPTSVAIPNPPPTPGAVHPPTPPPASVAAAVVR